MVQADDEQAFNLLYERYVKLAYYIAFRFCNNDADSQDVVQETFLQIKRTIKDLKNPDLFKYWLNKITISKCKNLFRSKRNVDMDQEDIWYQHHVTEDRFYMLPELKLHMETDKQLVHKLLMQLSEAQREVLVMRYFEHMTMQEMADALEVPVGTVKTRLLYGKNRLKELILAYEKENDTKINFRVDSMGMIALFTYVYHSLDIPKPIIAFRFKRKPHFSEQMINGVMASLTAVCLCSSVMAYQAYNSQSRNSQTYWCL